MSAAAVGRFPFTVGQQPCVYEYGQKSGANALPTHSYTYCLNAAPARMRGMDDADFEWENE